MRALVSYYGGKQRIASRIAPLLPRHTVYVEPFAGGAAVMFAKPTPPFTDSQHYRECINDVSGHLINLYRVMRDKSTAETLIHRLAFTPYARDDYELAVQILRSQCSG